MNLAYYEGKNTNPKEIIDLAETLPFFAERRVIVMENTGFFKNASPELAEYVKQMPETTYMIFVEEEVDKRGKLYKAVKDKGHIVELTRQDERTLVRWILGMAKKEGKQMSESAARYLLAKVGNDMENVIEVKHLNKSFGTHEVLKDIDFSVSKGEVVCIIGSSGSGKSTLLRCINLLETPSGGEIIYKGENILDAKHDIYKLRGQRVCVSFGVRGPRRAHAQRHPTGR